MTLSTTPARDNWLSLSPTSRNKCWPNPDTKLPLGVSALLTDHSYLVTRNRYYGLWEHRVDPCNVRAFKLRCNTAAISQSAISRHFTGVSVEVLWSSVVSLVLCATWEELVSTCKRCLDPAAWIYSLNIYINIAASCRVQAPLASRGQCLDPSTCGYISIYSSYVSKLRAAGSKHWPLLVKSAWTPQLTAWIYSLNI